MRVYHFTATDNWPAIERDGLVPRPSKKTEVQEWYGDRPVLWCWPEMPTGHALIGQVVWSAINAHCWRIMCVSFGIEDDEVLQPDEAARRRNGVGQGFFSLNHDGTLGSPENRMGPWPYHTQKPSILVGTTIAVERMTLVGDWDLEIAVERGLEVATGP